MRRSHALRFRLARCRLMTALKRRLPALIFITLLAQLPACALLPPRFDERAAAAGLAAGTIEAGGFVLRTYRSRPARPGERLHIYLDGDGRPWRADPTTAHRVVLELMELDPAPTLLIGRPCYYGMIEQAACRPALWTSERYGETVRDALVAAVNAVAAAHPGAPITLIGYSGGGALAALIAPDAPRVDRIVTIAANLDIDAWTRHHGEGDLSGSLNPAEQPPLPAVIDQLHLAGGRDRNVPARLNAAYLRRQSNARQKIYADQAHECCWTRVWPAVLSESSARRAAAAP